MNLKDKVVMVTGGTSGIGEACTRHFAELGAKVVTASVQAEEGARLEREQRDAGRDVRFVHTDVSEEQAVQDLVRRTVDAHGRVDAVHCNAGVWRKGRVTALDRPTWDAVMGVNVLGVMWAAKHAIPVMKSQDRGGVFLITTSVAAFVGFPEHALYCASKAALDALVRCLAVDHAGKVRVAAVCPGTVDTPMLAASCAGWDKPVSELYEEVARRIPTRRLGQPIDVARAAAFLLSDDASYITGTSLVLDGGTTALPPW